MIATLMSQWTMVSAILMASISPGGKTAEVSTGKESDVGKQLAVMSRVLEKRLGEDLKDEIVTASMLQRGIEGYYVAGVGALFFVDAKFAVAAHEPPKAVELPKPDDLWTRTEREIEGVTGPVQFDGRFVWVDKNPLAQPIRPPFDAKKVERLKTALLEVLAQFGKRLDAVADGERVIVVVSGGMLRPATGMALLLETTGDGGSALIVSIVKKDLSEDAKALAKRARIESYCY